MDEDKKEEKIENLDDILPELEEVETTTSSSFGDWLELMTGRMSKVFRIPSPFRSKGLKPLKKQKPKDIPNNLPKQKTQTFRKIPERKPLSKIWRENK